MPKPKPLPERIEHLRDRISRLPQSGGDITAVRNIFKAMLDMIEEMEARRHG